MSKNKSAFWSVGLLTLSLGACGGSHGTGNSGTGGNFASGLGSGGLPALNPSAGTRPMATGGSGPGLGSGGASTLGSGGVPSTPMATGGTNGGGGAGPAGNGGGGMNAGGMGGSGMAGSTGSSGGFIRGPAPTADSASKNGSYTVQMYTSGFKAPVSYGGGTIYYPTDAEPPFATVVICPGFTALQSSIAPWGPFFASNGIVTMTIDTKTTGDSVVQRADEIWEALGALQAENDRMGSPLQGKIDKMRAGVMGWSMGGGGTWIDASKHPELKTAFSLCGHDSTAGGPSSSPNIMVPTFLCAGQTDTPILGGGMSQPVYQSIPDSTPKMLFEIAGGDHFICNTPTSAGNLLARYGLSWQKVFLEGDDRYRQFLLQTPPMTSVDQFMTNVK